MPLPERRNWSQMATIRQGRRGGKAVTLRGEEGDLPERRRLKPNAGAKLDRMKIVRDDPRDLFVDLGRAAEGEGTRSHARNKKKNDNYLAVLHDKYLRGEITAEAFLRLGRAATRKKPRKPISV